MTREEAIASFQSLDKEQQLRFLAQFGVNLTVAARGTYVPGTDDVADPPKLRHANEMIHRVFGHMGPLLDDSSERYPDDVLVSIFWNEWPFFTKDARWAFEEALRRSNNA